MLVADIATLRQTLGELHFEKTLACDTETTGLDVHGDDALFGIVLSSATRSYFLNFNLYEDADPLDDEAVHILKEFFSDPTRTWIFHNAKFDLAFLRKAGFELPGKIVDTWVLDVLYDNRHHSHSLDSLAKRWGFEKLDTVKPYCDQHKLFSKVKNPELNKAETRYHYDQVPMKLMVEYACRDGRITYDIAMKIIQELWNRQGVSPSNWPSFIKDLENECALTQTMFEMEWEGAKIDRIYCGNAITHYNGEMRRIEEDFQKLTGKPFTQGPLIYKELFESEKSKWTFTALGNPSFDGDQLAKFDHPAAKMFLDHRGFKSQIQYFQNFLWFADKNDRLHTDYKQNVKTGRTSSSGPNLQNLTRPDEDDAPAPELFPVRRAIIPSPGNNLVMMDYKQIEYRLMLDRAKAHGVIRRIINEGLDVHTACATIAGCTRSQAKTVNFLSLYGGGKDKLAKDLGTTVAEAQRIQKTIFDAIPEVKSFIRGVMSMGETRGFVFNFIGRRYQAERGFEYKLSNHLIQGTAAIIIKIAMNRVREFLKDKKSKLILLVHDELVFDMHPSEMHLIPELTRIMVEAYQHDFLPMEVDVSWSKTNLADKEKWVA